MLFSLIIPCHNPDKTIYRLFDSLTRQNISKDELEIIVVDDNSDSLDYRKRLDGYGLNVKYCETNTNLHCPNNTRREGMKYITGKWLFFCDQDDYFENGALKAISDYIKANNPKYVISTIMRACSEDGTCYKEFAHKQAWLHGKWYSMDNLIRPYNINFKENLYTHEDIYFNSLVLAQIFRLRADWNYLDTYTYRWVDNMESITRRPTDDRGYLFENFSDYITAASEPYWKDAKKGDAIAINQIMMTILHCYFYYEAASYYFGAKDYEDIAQIIQGFIRKVIKEQEKSASDIIDYIYQDPYRYDAVKEDCKCYCGAFIPKTSLRDFVFILAK